MTPEAPVPSMAPETRWTRVPLHPLIFALYIVVFLWGVNATSVDWREGLFLCAAASAVAGIIFASCAAIVRERRAAA